MKLSVLALCVLGACSMSAYASTTNIVNAQSQFLMSHNGNKDDSSNVRKNGSYCETRTLNIVHNFEQDKTYQGVGIKKIDKVTGTYQTVCVKDGKQTFAPPYTQTYVNDITYEYQCTRRSEEKFEHYASDCVTSKNIYSNGVVGNDVRLMRFRGEENTDRSYSGIPSYESVVNSCNAMTLESRGTPVDACPIPIGAEGKQDIIRIEDISTQNNVATIRITDNKNTTDATATINYKSTKINLSKEWLDQLERVTIKNAKAKDWMFVTLKNPAGANAGVEPILQMPYVGNSAEPPQLHLCNNSQRFNWGTHSVSGSKVQDLSLIFNGIAGYKNISTTGNLSISQYPCEVNADSSGVNLAKARFPIVQGRHWEMNGGSLSATWDTPEVVNRYNGVIPIHNGQIVKDFQTRECKDPYLPREDKEICKLGDDLAPFIYNESNRRQGVAGSGLFKVYRKNDILPLLLQGFNNIEILTIGRDKNMELTIEFTFKGNKPSISKKIEDEKNNCYGRGHDASCNEQNNENNNTGGNNPMVPPDELDNPIKSYKGWAEYYCEFGKLKNRGVQICKNLITSGVNPDERTSILLNEGYYQNDLGHNAGTGISKEDHDNIMKACNNLLDSYIDRLGISIKSHDSSQQLNCRNTAHQKYRACLENKRDNYSGIKACFAQETQNINNYIPTPLFEPLIAEQCGKLSNGEVPCKDKFTNELIKTGYKCSEGDATNCISTIIGKIQQFKPDDYYINKPTAYDGWISYICNEDTSCLGKWKSSSLAPRDLESELKKLGEDGLLANENNQIRAWCKLRASRLTVKNGDFLESICYNEIVEKHKSCLIENKGNLQAIQTCFANKQGEIRNWYNEGFMLTHVQSQCKQEMKGNEDHIRQCNAQFNLGYIKNFMNNHKDNSNNAPLHLDETLSGIDLAISQFKPVLQDGGNTIISTYINQGLESRCLSIHKNQTTNPENAIIKNCLAKLQQKYKNCLQENNQIICNRKIRGFSDQ